MGTGIHDEALACACACICVWGSACASCVSSASGQISSSSRQGDRPGEVAEVVVEEDDVCAAGKGESHSVSLSRARERALLRCLRAREATRVGGGETINGETEDMILVGELG